VRIVESYIAHASYTFKDHKQWPISIWKNPDFFAFHGLVIQDKTISYGSTRYLMAYYVRGRDA